MILLHTGPRSLPEPLYLPAGSFGIESAGTVSFSPPTQHPEKGRRPETVRGAALEAARDAAQIGAVADHDWDSPATYERYLRVEIRERTTEAQAAWDAAMVPIIKAARLEHEDRTFARSLVWQGPRWLPSAEGLCGDHAWRVHESPEEIEALIGTAEAGPERWQCTSERRHRGYPNPDDVGAPEGWEPAGAWQPFATDSDSVDWRRPLRREVTHGT